jgi:hypothetical protein
LERCFTDRRVDVLALGLAMAAATAVMGMGLQPENAPIFSRRSGRAMANPQRKPAMP